MGLGADPTRSRSTHIRVRVKDDMLGLGSRLKKKKTSGNNTDIDIDDDTTGLDVFQRILGRLNGRGSESVERELEIQRKENYIGGKWGVNFVKGDVLASTWDPVTKRLKSYSKMGTDSSLSSSSETEDGDDKSLDGETVKSKKRKHSDGNDTSSSGNGEDKAKNSKKKLKRDKKDKKEKKDKKSKRKKEAKEGKKVKKAKKIERKLRLQELKEKEKEEREEEEREGMLTTSSSATSIPDVVSTRLSVRSRWIKQKKAALMDQKALSEIFMIRTPSPQPSTN